MVDLEDLARRARWAAERGRLLSAIRLAAIVFPLATLGTVVSSSPPLVVAVAVVLFGVTVLFAWQNAEGRRAATLGLKLGAIPMSASVLTLVIERWCAPDGASTLCGVGCLLAGVVAGGIAAWRALGACSPNRARTGVKMGLVACLTAGLGCLGLGMGGTLGVLAAMAAGSLAVWVPTRLGA